VAQASRAPSKHEGPEFNSQSRKKKKGQMVEA
jgi:hypothetical protein